MITTSNLFRFINRAIDVFERAHRVGRLDELVRDPKNFVWSGIPEFKSKYFID